MRAHTLVATLLVIGIVFSALPVTGQGLRAGLERLSQQIIESAPEGKQLSVVISDFSDLQNVISDFGRFVASRLTTRLAQSQKFLVVERQRLEQVLAELKFSMSDLADPTKAKQLGRMVGVEAILVGAVADLGNNVDIDARLVEIETRRTLLSATVTISKDPMVNQLLGQGKEPTKASPQSGTPLESPPAAQPLPPSPQKPRSSATPQVEARATPPADVAKALKESAAALTVSAGRGRMGYIPPADGNSMIEEFNLILRKAKLLFPDSLFLQAWQEAVKESDGNVAARKVAVLAKGLQYYLGSFTESDSVRESAAILAENANRGGYITPADGNSLIGVYNVLVRLAKSTSQGPPLLQTLEEVREERDGVVAARKVVRLANELEMLFGGKPR